MASRASVAHPIERLREQATALEAALTVCVAGATVAAVHRLRTTTRRVEAQTTLLTMLKGLPPHRREAARLHKQMRKMRQLAGRVRDLDVEAKLIRRVLRAGTKSRTQEKLAERKAGAELLALLAKRREEEAAALKELLEARQGKISSAIEGLMKALKPSEALVVTATDLEELARRWFARYERRSGSVEALHATRKAAKTARYMAEGAPGSARAAKLAQEFEEIQEAGGVWHDWLQLTELVKKKAPLGASFRRHRDASLRAYRERLEGLVADKKAYPKG